VPFTYETRLSGIGDEARHDNIWYHKTIMVDMAALDGKDLLLHFEGSDFVTKVWVNGKYAGCHRGGYARFTMDITNLYLCRPAPEETPEDWLWTRTDYVLYRTRNDVRTILETQPILNLEEDAKIQECWISQSPSFTIEEPQEGDIFELWVMLELANGLSLEECAGSWVFRNGDFEILE